MVRHLIIAGLALTGWTTYGTTEALAGPKARKTDHTDPLQIRVSSTFARRMMGDSAFDACMTGPTGNHGSCTCTFHARDLCMTLFWGDAFELVVAPEKCAAPSKLNPDGPRLLMACTDKSLWTYADGELRTTVMKADAPTTQPGHPAP